MSRFHATSGQPGNGNHYFEMWKGQNLRTLTAFCGLTNNRTLFVNSHGKLHRVGRQIRYAFYPHASLVPPRRQAPCFSARDLATLLGTETSNIHNVVVAGCDTDAAFSSAELRKYFANATNIVHAVAGQAGYQPMFLQAILAPSDQVQSLYELARTTSRGSVEYLLSNKPAPNATQLMPYVAELFRPGSNRPFRTQIAGRELLDAPGAAYIEGGTAEESRIDSTTAHRL